MLKKRDYCNSINFDVKHVIKRKGNGVLVREREKKFFFFFFFTLLTKKKCIYITTKKKYTLFLFNSLFIRL